MYVYYTGLQLASEEKDWTCSIMPLSVARVQVTQYACDYPNLAPPGCTQYYFGRNSDFTLISAPL